MVTGLRGFDPDDFVDEDKERRRDEQLQREQNISDRQSQSRRRMDNMQNLSNAERAELIRQQNLEANRRRLNALMGVVNDDSIELTPEDVKVINDPQMRMMSNGEVVRRTGRDIIRSSGQFSRSSLLGGIDISRRNGKRRRKRTKTDKNMSKALRMANDKFRKKNGQLRKGASQAQIMRYAHKLLKKM